ncbi:MULTISPECIES: ATP-binding cassette domain-containing protein [Enterococcus]|uniref:ATP-binding cassette domain-containing protein n=1 Tax=Enterococcus TaxID=1350 RepID=UPI000A3302A3|nr:excinuclease ABC subunit UvrA [Enterococcus faecalis]OTP17089.1 excinuclease ABC subunit A [Enterococcus faecalis]
MEWIEIKHASQNNLKNISVNIPKKQLTVVTGLSGSGKSSLVFDTLAAESRRELNDTFSSFVQNYLPKYGRPEVEKIENLPVAIVIDQKKVAGNSRSTVGTYTDIYTFLRLLFSRAGSPFVGYSDTFSFNHPDGKCPTCDGLGKITEINLHQLVDYDKSLNEGPIDFPTFTVGNWRWKRYAHSGLFDLDKKIKDYSPEELALFLYAPQQKLANPPKEWPHTALYEGIVPRMQRSILHTDEGKRHQKYLNHFVTVKRCPDCLGSRVNERVRSCKINQKSIADAVDMPLTELHSFIRSMDLSLIKTIQEELLVRLEALINIGLSYLTLGRATETLSGGEAQRIKIAKYVNSALNDIMYILDEPSAGLHPKDIERISRALLNLKNKGNTVVLVEHNPQLIREADFIIDIGPFAGENGGHVQFSGTYDAFLASKTLTSQALQEPLTLNDQPRIARKSLTIEHATLHNLNNLSVEVPLGVLTVICGVAGSGKSSLAEEIYQKAQADNQEIIHLSQKSITANLRSTPMTYLNIFDKVRKLFAEENHVSPALFSYNSKGACPTCKGKGIIVSDMSFMEDVTSICETCHGTRYKEEVLHYLYNGKNIVEVLALSVKDGYDFFKDQPFALSLKNLLEVGLGYLKLNQSLSTLSGGELQRVKLADTLHQKKAIYLMDEPTDGLHLIDIQQSLQLFNRMVEEGNSLILLEHHIDVIKSADWLIELGPEGGENGGQLLFTGTPANMLNSTHSITKGYL